MNRRRCGALLGRVIADAREIGYVRMVLDTYAAKMRSAVAPYRGFGFTETGPHIMITRTRARYLWGWS